MSEVGLAKACPAFLPAVGREGTAKGSKANRQPIDFIINHLSASLLIQIKDGRNFSNACLFEVPI
jgi:hypothetical protein